MNEPGRSQKRQEADWFLLGLLGIGIVMAVFTFWLDQPSYWWISTHEAKPLKNVAGLLSKYGDTPELMLIAFVALTACWWARWKKAFMIVLCVLLGATIAGGAVNAIRLTSGRARPNNKEAIQEWNGPWHDGEWTIPKNKYNSFPSGHTAGAFGFFGVLVFARLSYAALAVIPAVAIGWSRFYLGAHHLSDVWIGMLAGLVTAFLVWHKAGPWIEKKLNDLAHFRTVRG